MMGHHHLPANAEDPARTDHGFVRPGVAAVILLAAVVGLLLAAPDALLPEWPPRTQAPGTLPTERTGDRAPDPGIAAVPEPPTPETQTSETEKGQADDPLSDLWAQVRRRLAQARDLFQPPGTGRTPRPGVVPFDSGTEDVVTAMDLGIALRTSDGVARWKRVTARYPELRDLSPVMVKARLMGVWPTRHLMAVGADALVLEDFCRELTAGGTPCETVRVDVTRIAGGLARPPVLSLPPEESAQDARRPRSPDPAVRNTGFAETVVEIEDLRTEDFGAALSGADGGTVRFRLGELPDAARQVRIVAVGDVMMGSDHPDANRLNPALVPGAGADAVLEADLLALLRGADLTFANLEGSLGRGGAPAKDCVRCYSFRSPPHYAAVLADAGVDVVSLANNHAGDFGPGGLAATIDALGGAGIAVSGLQDPKAARRASLTTLSGLTVAVLAFAPNRGTLDLLDTERAVTLVREAATAHDVVLVSAHAGAEGVTATRVARRAETYLGEARGDIHAFAHAVIKAGADLVIGHGPHVPRAVEVIDGRLAAYSLGNFWTYAGFVTWGLLGLGPVLDVTLDEEGAVVAFAIHSTRQAGEGLPRLDPRGEAARFILDRTARDFPRSFERLSRLRLANRV
ncbi:MAG: CapA family protein [Alphaproteobacteria bacterium]